MKLINKKSIPNIYFQDLNHIKKKKLLNRKKNERTRATLVSR